MTASIITAIVSCCVSFFLGGALTFVVAKFKGAIKHGKALEDGVQSLLRNQLIEYHDKYTETRFLPYLCKGIRAQELRGVSRTRRQRRYHKTI